MSKIKILPLLALTAVLIAMLTPSVARTAMAQAGANTAITLKAEAAFEGAFKYGEWVPVWVNLENAGPDLQAEVRISVIGGGGTMIFINPVELPTGARKRLAVYALPNNFSRQLVVELYNDDKLLTSQKVAIQPSPAINYLVGIVAPQRGALALLETLRIPGQTRPVKLYDLNLADFPDKFEGLRSFDLIVINDTDTSVLTSDQANALEGWVRQGGRLVVGGGANAARTAAGLPPSLLPVAEVKTAPVETLPGLERFAGLERPIRVAGPFILSQGKLAGGRSLAAQGSSDLLHEWASDSGAVDWSALDLAGAPFDAWNGAINFWEKILLPGAIFPANAPIDVSARQQFASNLNYPLSNLPMLDLPSVGSLALLLGLYVILVGPFNYFFLRRIKRMHLAWLTIPAITLIFAAASFGLGYVLRGSNVFVNKIAFVQPQADGKAKVISFLGLFTPAQQNYRVDVRGGGNLVSPLGPFYDPWMSSSPGPLTATGRRIELVQGDPATIRGVSMDAWSTQSFMAEGIVSDFGVISSDLRIEDGRLRGRVTNKSAPAMTDVMVVLGMRVARLGDLSTGDGADVDLPLNDFESAPTGGSISYAIFNDELSSANGRPARQVEVRRAIIENVFDRVPPYITAPGSQEAASLYQVPVLIGWQDQAPPEVRIVGEEAAQQTTAVVISPLTYRLVGSGEVEIPGGLIWGSLEEAPINGGACGATGLAGVYMPSGQAVFKFVAPESAGGLHDITLKINLTSDASMSGMAVTSLPELALWDWQNDRWLRLEGATFSENQVPQADALVNAQGEVRVRLATENAQNCFYVELGMKGRR